MRDGILEAALKAPNNKMVLIVGPESLHGLKYVKSDVVSLNRASDKPWINTDFREKIPPTCVTPKYGLIMSLHDMNGSVCAALKLKARELDVEVVLNQSLTINEAREILRALHDKRQAEKPAVVKAAQNGNGAHPVEEKTASAAPSTEAPELAPRQSLQGTESAPLPPGVLAVKATSEGNSPATPTSKVDALTLLERAAALTKEFAELNQEIQFAVMMVREENKAIQETICAERAKHAVGDARIAELEALSEKQKKEAQSLADSNGDLRKQLDDVRGKMRKADTKLREFAKSLEL